MTFLILRYIGLVYTPTLSPDCYSFLSYLIFFIDVFYRCSVIFFVRAQLSLLRAVTVFICFLICHFLWVRETGSNYCHNNSTIYCVFYVCYTETFTSYFQLWSSYTNTCILQMRRLKHPEYQLLIYENYDCQSHI